MKGLGAQSCTSGRDDARKGNRTETSRIPASGRIACALGVQSIGKSRTVRLAFFFPHGFCKLFTTGGFLILRESQNAP